jgi:putative acetyltransferase
LPESPPNDPAVTIRGEPITSATAQALVQRLNAELIGRYPEEGANHFRLDPEELAPGRGAFLIAYLDGAPVGCGAVRREGEGTAEIKRMFVDPAHRGRGIASAVLTALEAEARRLGARRLVLETGHRQPEALALYQRHGFLPTAAFGGYIGSRLSICLAKDLP